MREPPTRTPPITGSDAEIARALEESNVPALILALVHLTGDRSLLEGDVRPVAVTMGDEQGQLTLAQQADVRRRALGVLRDLRDGRLEPGPAPGHDPIHEMMSFMVGETVSPEYVPMFEEEMGLAPADARALHWERELPAERRRAFRVLVIGAGMSGILAAIRLEQAGIPYLVIEKNRDVGGTWFENTYPGCRVDVPNHFYSYSFAPNHEWPHHFSTWDELLAYFRRCADAYGVREKILFETEVTAAAWQEERAEWHVVARTAGGHEETFQANALVSAVGQLSRPRLPDIPGVASFGGESFHSAAWRHDVALAGKRIAVIGTGASAFQFVPEIAPEASELYVFQRTPPWMFPTANYHEGVGEGQKWCLEHVPFYASWYRFWLFWTLSDGLLPALEIDPDYPDPDRAVSEANAGVRALLEDYLKAQVQDERPDLVEKILPDYVVGGKRMLRDNGSWLAALKRPNVHVVTEPITEITEKGPRTADREYPVDVLIHGTGFKADHFLWPMELTGRGGVTLAEHWGDDPRAYLGITVPRFPNLFLLYGPNTNLVHGGSIIFQSECQMRYVLGCLKLLVEGGHRSLEPRQDVHDAYNERVDAANARRAWAHPKVSSWYKNRRGRITQNWPFRLVDFWAATRAPDPGDFELR